jgi:putative GTP pyrophosphokinase
MTDIELARQAWLVDRPAYEAFGDLLSTRLTESIRRLGVWFEVSARAKELDSLVKKLLKKPEHSYESLPDKLGIRVIVRFRSDIKPVIETVLASLDHDAVDDKLGILGTDRVGYQSVHIDHLRLRENDANASQFPGTRFWAELQVRTLAQHLWSEMSHDTVYKNDDSVEMLESDIKRRVSLMAGQIEVADREFDRLNGELLAEPRVQLLKALERRYFKLTSRRPDTGLSLQVLDKIIPLYGVDPHEIEVKLDQFLESRQSVLDTVFSEGNERPERRSAFLFQPEVLMLYERLTNDPISTRRVWVELFPERELKRVANSFGISFD